MVLIHPLGLFAPSTLYNSQEIPHSWTTPQVIPHTWEFLSDITHLDFSSQRFTNEDRKYSHKILVQNFRLKCTRKTRIERCTNDTQVLKQWCTQKHSQGSNIFKKGLGRLNSWNNKDWSLFIEENDQTNRWGFDRSR